MFLNSKLDAQEIEREKGFISEEMNLYKDTPTRYIEDLFEELLYKNQPAGRLIIGTKENVKSFTREKILDYFKKQYQAKDTTIFITGDASKLSNRQKIKEMTDHYFANLGTGKKNDKVKVLEDQKKPDALLHFKETDQSHLILGLRAYNARSPKIYPLTLLSTILGGNMSSRLFIEVRERRGLAYYIKSGIQSYTDSGYLGIQAGVPNGKLIDAIKVILEELKKIREGKISKEEIKKGKDYLKGKLMLDLESSDEVAFFMAEQKVIRDEIRTPDEISKKIDRVTQDDVQKIAREIFRNSKLNLAIVGPHKQKQRFAGVFQL
jgi:predicted Zn-dependent peptidase